MQTQLIPVPFYEDTLVLVNSDNEPMIAMKPLVENMGLSWASQYVKLTEKFSSVVSIIETTGADGKKYEMTCLPLRKIHAWLYSVNPNKVNPEIRAKVERYQNECDDALWNYWTKGSASRPGALSVTERLRVHKARHAVLDRLESTTHGIKRQALHEELTELSTLLGYPAPALTLIGSTVPDVPPCLEEFWDVITELQGKNVAFNHARSPNLLALNLTHLQSLAKEHGLELAPLAHLRAHLKNNRSPNYVEIRVVNSAITGKAMRCYVFEGNLGDVT